jgi:membrane associated rhomboid family serine protease
MSITLVIVTATVIASLIVFNDRSFQYKLTFSAYAVKHQRKWWLLFTHGFVHGDMMHLFFNMFVLFHFGEVIEAYFEYIDKWWLFPVFYMSCLPFASLPALIKHGDNPNYLAVGASGSVTGIVFIYILLLPFNKLYLMFIPIGIPAIVFGVLYLVFEYYSSKRGGTNIAHDAHMAGAVYGIAFITLFNPQVWMQFIEQIKMALS